MTAASLLQFGTNPLLNFFLCPLSFVCLCVCVCVCTCCMKCVFFFFYFPPSQFKLDSPHSVCSVDICTDKSHPRVWGRATKRTLYFGPRCPWIGFSVKYTSLYVRSYMFVRLIWITTTDTDSARHSKFKFDVYVTLTGSISARWCNHIFLPSSSSSCAVTRGGGGSAPEPRGHFTAKKQ